MTNTLSLFPRWESNPKVQYCFGSTKCMFGRTLIYLQVGITGIIQLAAQLQVYIMVKSSAQCTFRTGIPPAQLEMGIIGLAKETVFNMGYNTTDTRFAE